MPSTTTCTTFPTISMRSGRSATTTRASDCRWKVAESGPAIDRIVLGKEGAAEQIERYKRIVGHLGKLGVEVVAYNFMPQVSEDAMVVRTAFNATTRGGARTSGFRLRRRHRRDDAAQRDADRARADVGQPRAVPQGRGAGGGGGGRASRHASRRPAALAALRARSGSWAARRASTGCWRSRPARPTPSPSASAASPRWALTSSR